MLKPLPLLDKKVLVPRGEKQAKTFSRMVKQYGGIPIEIPLIAFRPIRHNVHLGKCLEVMDTYDWIIFTSNIAVETFLACTTSDSRLPKIAVIGKKTEEALHERGIPVEFLPSSYVAEVFASEFLKYINQGTRVLIPKGNLARDYIAETLKKAGALVEEVVIYENFLPEESRQTLVSILQEHKLDILLFTSSSTVDHFMQVVKEHGLSSSLSESIIGCIGPVTQRTLQNYGLPVHVTPKEYTVEKMIKSTIEYLDRI
ncbi:uroporphyrinogen-III synthase [Bacillus sp. BRMEA1]|uniref:uroporphyrinogen-III synthase n=1 Tax=Neobacillus endophyticus TaxID=2738405 RepID=UPI0015679A6A|nr:uroporphyrinogen-III synthase [Neobacillus endophyticus]NRD76025.1 uroporphyrinogen-III synthase [Neobacillus endophyticus]